MGYHTEIRGGFTPARPVTPKVIRELERLANWDNDPNWTPPPNSILTDPCPWEIKEEEPTLGADVGQELVCQTDRPDQYLEWLEWLTHNLFADNPLTGEASWAGDDPEDRGAVRLDNNQITIGKYLLTWENDEPEKEKWQRAFYRMYDANRSLRNDLAWAQVSVLLTGFQCLVR